MLQVGIVVPSWHYYHNPFKIQPLWELYFATRIRSRFRENEVKVILVDLREIRKGKTFNEIEECDLYIYWTLRTGDFSEIREIVKTLHNQYPQSVHVGGGTHVDNCLAECTEVFDAVIRGPGEESFITIADELLRGEAIFATSYYSDWKRCHFSQFPHPSRNFLSIEKIINKEHFEKYGCFPATVVQFSRGCNFQCIYCNYNVPKTIQRRTPKQVEEEIEYLKSNYKIQGINLRDEIAIPLSDQEAIPFLEAIGRTDIKWRGQTKVGASKDGIKLAVESGCLELAIGVETVSDKILKIIKKGCNLKQIKDCFRLCHFYGINTKMCLILGLPEEPKDIVAQMIAFIEEVAPKYVSVSGLCPMPGSPMFENPEKYGIQNINKDWERYGHVLYRYSDSEGFGLPFKYEEGKGFTRSEIISNIQEIQHYLQGKGMSY